MGNGSINQDGVSRDCLDWIARPGRAAAFCARWNPPQLAEIIGRMQVEDMALRAAVAALEQPRLAARLAKIAGKPDAEYIRKYRADCSNERWNLTRRQP